MSQPGINHLMFGVGRVIMYYFTLTVSILQHHFHLTQKQQQRLALSSYYFIVSQLTTSCTAELKCLLVTISENVYVVWEGGVFIRGERYND